MSLWNIIRDFYVQYIFGGVTSGSVSYQSVVGTLTDYEGNAFSDNYVGSTTNIIFHVGDTTPEGVSTYMNLGDWLSTTFTIITLILFVFFLYVFLRWLFKVVSGLILLRN